MFDDGSRNSSASLMNRAGRERIALLRQVAETRAGRIRAGIDGKNDGFGTGLDLQRSIFEVFLIKYVIGRSGATKRSIFWRRGGAGIPGYRHCHVRRAICRGLLSPHLPAPRARPAFPETGVVGAGQAVYQVPLSLDCFVTELLEMTPCPIDPRFIGYQSEQAGELMTGGNDDA